MQAGLLVVALASMIVAGAVRGAETQGASAQSDVTAGIELYQKADYAAAVARLERAVTAGLDVPDRIRVREMLAISYFALGQIARATETIRALLGDDPAHEPATSLPIDFKELFAEVKKGAARTAALEAELATLRTAPSGLPSGRGDPVRVTWVDLPAGSFQMGCASGADRPCSEAQPRHSMTLAAFRLMATETTQAMYRAYTSATSQPFPPQDARDQFDLPVINVGWKEAIAFCRWANARLPTEAEFEYAARAGTATTYWWGNTYDPSRENIGTPAPQAVGQPAHRNPWGLYDMLGNVLEWTSTLYRAYPYSATDGREDLNADGLRVMRGGPWFRPSQLPVADMASSRSRRNPADTRSAAGIGFRCAQ